MFSGVFFGFLFLFFFLACVKRLGVLGVVGDMCREDDVAVMVESVGGGCSW